MPDINPVAQYARQPRGAVKLAGVVVDGWESFEVDNNDFRSADTFRIVFASSALPAGYGADWFSKQTKITVEIFAGFPKNPDKFSPADLCRLILGNADDITFDPVAATIEVSGRDQTALLIDTKTSEHFANQTSSQIATALAVRHGLRPIVTATTTKAGDYYKDDHASTTQEQSEWDLLGFLANMEDFRVYVSGNELHFEPHDTASAGVYAIEWVPPSAKSETPSSNAEALRFSRNLTIAKGISVEVHSWNSKHKKGFSATFPRSAKTAKPGQSSGSQVYKYNVPGLTQEQAQQRAQAIYKQITAHAMNLSADLPADNVLSCTDTIQVRGTGTGFDQTYYPDSVTRRMSIEDGYRMTITAKNISPELDQQQ